MNPRLMTMAERACQCEHVAHFTGEGHPYQGVLADPAWTALHVGRVCAGCATGHLAEVSHRARKGYCRAGTHGDHRSTWLHYETLECRGFVEETGVLFHTRE